MTAAILLAALLGGTPAVDDASLLPADGAVAGLARDGAAEVFRGAELYGHIDGGAEIYLEVGFERVTVQRYRRGEDELTAELYRMSDPTAALAVYLGRCGDETPDAGLAERHTAGRHQLLLVKGGVFLAVNNDTGRAKGAPLLVEVARAVAARLPDEAAPAPGAALPAGWLPGSLRVVRGPVGLGAIVTLGDGDVLRLGGTVTAAAAAYDDARLGRHTRLVADYPDATAARAALAHVAAHLDEALTLIRHDGDVLVYRDWAGRFGDLAVADRRLTLRANLARDPGMPATPPLEAQP